MRVHHHYAREDCAVFNILLSIAYVSTIFALGWCWLYREAPGFFTAVIAIEAIFWQLFLCIRAICRSERLNKNQL